MGVPMNKVEGTFYNKYGAIEFNVFKFLKAAKNHLKNNERNLDFLNDYFDFT